MPTRRRALTALILPPAALLASLAFASPDDEEDKHKHYDFAPATVEAFAPAPSMRIQAEFGATPGGAQDINYARDRILAGEVPHPETFTPEGLFSRHDLPLPADRPCKQTLCLAGAATAADLLAQPEVRMLAQLGFTSGLDPATWKRAPLALVAVVDKSGSMSGQPLETVKDSLHRLVDQLGPADRIAIVLYGDRTHVHLAPTAVKDREALHRAIEGIQSAGSTAMEAGLTLGFDVARDIKRGFAGTTRVMLFTDERPNVGATDKQSFMGLARAASHDGIGMTTIGVSTHFGAELATAVSSVRGGNLFFFPDAARMVDVFKDELDTMVTELAHDFRLTVEPGRGWQISGLYGIPGDMVKPTANGGYEMTIETIFLSRNKGAIYVAFKPAGDLPAPHGAPGGASVRYTDASGRVVDDRVGFDLVDDALPLGLARGLLLVDEVTALKKATALHLHDNDQEGAYRMVQALRRRFEIAEVPGLDEERAMIAALDATLTRLSGHQGEGGAAIARDPVSGLPQ
ncbi:MAG: VWA domain-containing protein [Myxococcales bacterium]|nr:VWA domain-containing protein [Myxococcales bacterium]